MIHEFENGRQWIRCSLSTLRGKAYADIRVWFEPKPGAPMKPTQKGISVLVENLDELEAALIAYRKALGPGYR
jgi:Transcriptional Coactivator p15 (PC4)